VRTFIFIICAVSSPVKENVLGGPTPPAGDSSPIKDCMRIMAAEGTEYKETVYWYDGLMKHLGWTDRGKVLAGGGVKPGGVSGKPVVEEAHRLGASIQ
jgi:hypothetical protein